jgi:succinyl-CoA synthetase alpha subunit
VVNCIPKAETKPVAGNLDTAGFDWKLLDDIPFFTTLDEAFKSCEFDAAVIALPTQFHAQAAIDCINNGKKPVRVLPESSLRSVELVEQILAKAKRI